MTVEICKVRIKLGFSFFAVITLMLLSAENEIVIICLLSSFFHECGHIIFMCIFSQKPSEIVLGAFGMRIERPSLSTLSYKKEAVIACAGVLFNAALVALFLLYFYFSHNKIAYIGVLVNIFIALLNCIPISVLDSGNFLRYILLVSFDEEKVMHILSKVSSVSTAVFTFFTVLYTVLYNVNYSLIAVCVYLITLNFKSISANSDME